LEESRRREKVNELDGRQRVSEEGEGGKRTERVKREEI
jgi:hypothetical protein